MDNRSNLPTAADRRETQPSSPSSDWATVDGLVPHLSACLALVRPVSMSEDAAAEWIAVAAGELAGYRRTSVEAALSDVRQRCTHHGQIIPHAIRYMEELTPWRMGKPLARHLPNQSRPRELAPPESAALIGQATRALTRHPGHAD